jgi:hypothetical protein
MSIIQISKIQQRSGDLVDLPQLDTAEFGFATDASRLFIGNPDANLNVEVLTNNSTIYFSQINGANTANLDLSNLGNGQVLGIEIVGSNKFVTNKGGNVGGLIDLGNVSNVMLDGGSSGQLLMSNGAGGLSFVGVAFVPPVGPNTAIQFNDAGSFQGLANLTFNKVTGVVSLPTLNVTANGNVTGNLTVAGNIIGRYANGNTNINIPSANGNITFSVTGNSNVVVISGSSANVNGILNATTVRSANLTTGSSGTAGTITGNWTLSPGSRMQATYADLAEYYSADKQYGPGTVLEFGGEQEVTLATDSTSRVAGVVSTDPAYIMNSKCAGQYPVALALQGRVPVKVRGTIRKGDLMISGGNGYARPTNNPIIGSIIGKSLENFNGIEGVIEIAVGRL